MSLADLRALLRKGKARPAPGPDGWEKWWIKTLSDNSLCLVLDLLNYEIMNSHFPDSIKPVYISAIHKRGPATDLSNYRGVSCVNFIANTPFAWCNSLLIPYIAKLHILPEGQVATQKGVQGRDLASFFAQLQTWSTRTSTPVYILRRDQKKGFDHLEPQGFYDAITAYGLPRSLIDFDQSAQSNVPYRVKTAYGFTDSFIISGVTKQGGPMSPLKSTLTTSLGNHWLYDSLSHTGDILTISSLQSRLSQHHVPDDALVLRPTMMEATDDSAIITPTLTACKRSCLLMERFQAAYGWATNWDKSLLCILNLPDPPATISMPTVSLTNPHADSPISVDVKVSANAFDFLRVHVNDPDRQYQKIRDIVLQFALPNLHSRLPLTALRRIFMQRLLSRIRPHLSYQAITPAQAIDIDHLIAQRVHEYFSFPFRFNSTLLSLPLRHFGLDFPCVASLNDAYAISGLLRDLNHHIPAFKLMARVTLTDWTCSLNHCRYPLDGDSLHRSFTRCRCVLPASWITAHSALSRLNISLRNTDISYLLTGDVAIRHILRALPASSSLHPPPPAAYSLQHYGITHLNQLGRWRLDPALPSRSYSFHAHQTLKATVRGIAVQYIYPPALRTWVSSPISLLRRSSFRRSHCP